MFVSLVSLLKNRQLRQVFYSVPLTTNLLSVIPALFTSILSPLKIFRQLVSQSDLKFVRRFH